MSWYFCRHRCVSTRILLSQGRPRLLSERLRCLGVKRASQLGSVNRKSGIHPCVYASSASLLTRLLCYKRPLDEKPASCPASCMFRNLVRSLNIWDHIIDRFRNPGKKSANPGIRMFVFHQKGREMVSSCSLEWTAVPPSFLQAATQASISSKPEVNTSRQGRSSRFTL